MRQFRLSFSVKNFALLFFLGLAPAPANGTTITIPANTSLAANQCKSSGALQICMQGDGNLVIYNNGQALWASSLAPELDAAGFSGVTAGLACSNCSAAFQGDGNLVLYNPNFSGNPYHSYWASNSWGHSNVTFSISDVAPYLSIGNGTGALLYASSPPGAVNLASFCPLNSSADSTACMQTAINQTCAAGGGILYIPAGSFNISTVVVRCQGLTIQGAGRKDGGHVGGTQLFVTNTTNAAIQFIATNVVGDYSYGGGVRDLSIITQPGNITNPSIRFKYCMGCFVRNVYFWNPFKAVDIFAGISPVLTDLYVNNLRPGGVAIEFRGQYTGQPGCNSVDCNQRADALNMNNIYVGASTAPTVGSSCLHWHGFAATVEMQNFTCVGQDYGIRSDCYGNPSNAGGSSTCPQFLEANNFQCLNCTTAVSALDTGSLNFVSSVFQGTPRTNNLVTINTALYPNGTNGASFLHSYATTAGASCLWIAASDVVVNDMAIGNCNLANVGAVGVAVTNTNSAPGQSTKNVNINNNLFCAIPGYGNPAMTPIYLDGTNPNWVNVHNNIFRGCPNGAISSSSGNHISIDGTNVSVDASASVALPAKPTALTAANTWQPAHSGAGVVTSVMSFCQASQLGDANATTQCMQAAINATCSSILPGQIGTVNIPAGRYTINSLTVPCAGLVLQGAGRGNRDTLSGTALWTTNAASVPAIAFSATGVRGNANNGGGIRDLDIINDVNGVPSNYPSVQFNYCNGCFADNLYFWTPAKAVEVHAGANVSVTNIFVDQLLSNGTAFDIHGTYTGAAGCTSIDGCDQRAVNTYLANIFVGQIEQAPVTSTCVNWHDLAQGLTMNNIGCIGSAVGFRTSCAVTGAGENACPANLSSFSFQCDFCGNGITAYDATNLYFTNSYFNGQLDVKKDGTGTPGADHMILLSSQNFPNGSQKANFDGGQLASSFGSCAWVAQSNVSFTNMGLWNCNAGNYGAAGIELNSGGAPPSQKISNIFIADNNFCTRYDSANTTMAGVYVQNSSASNTTIANNIFNGCRVGAVSNAAASNGNNILQNLGP